jgi:DNA invertase Pin-like site-specific DNA recombinase
MIYGYARHIGDENECRIQITALQNSFCKPIFIESENAIIVSDFPELEKLFASIDSGDVLVVQNLRILANSVSGLCSIATRLKDAGAGIRSLEDCWCDSTTFDGVLDTLAGISTFDRTDKVARTTMPSTGIEPVATTFIAASPGTLAQIETGLQMVAEGISVRDAAKRVGVHHATLYRAMKRGRSIELSI